MKWKPLPEAMMFTVLFASLCLLSQLVSGGYHSDWGQASDEAAHFVTSLMIFDYVSAHLGENPINFAMRYYEHLPRVAIGHFPPLFEITQAISFVFGRTGTTALGLQAIVFGLYAGLPATIVAQRAGPILGLVAGAVVFLSPHALFLTNTVMADSFLGVMVLVSGLIWEMAYKHRTWTSYLMFAIMASLAILTKGSAIGLALLPPIYLMIKRDLADILSIKTIVSAFTVLVITLPWYAITYRYAFGGFKYSFGLAFTSVATYSYLEGIVGSLGVIIFLGYLVGCANALFNESEDVDLHVALSLAILAFLTLAPADITPRYLIPVLPSMAIVAISGLSSLIEKLPLYRWQTRTRTWLVVCVAAASTATTFQSPHVEPFHSREAVNVIVNHSDPNPLILVSGSALAEGSVIAAFAERESDLSHYVVRATKVLSSSNWMGSDYKTRFAIPEEMKRWITENQIAYIIFCDDAGAKEFSHNAVLRNILNSDGNTFKEIAYIKNKRGHIGIYMLPAVNVVPAPTNSVFAEVRLQK